MAGASDALGLDEAGSTMTTGWPHGVAQCADTALIGELQASTRPGDVVLLFGHPDALTDEWLARLSDVLRNVTVLGMSVAGAAGTGAMLSGGVSWLVLPREHNSVAFLATPTPQDEHGWQQLADDLLRLDEEQARRALDMFPAIILFATGMDGREEQVAARLHLLFPERPLAGGTAATTVGRSNTFVIVDGRAVPGHHLIVLLRSTVSLRAMHHHHFEPGPESFVVTANGETPRFVTELDGYPARDVVARALGCAPHHLTVERCSQRPFGMRLQGQWYIRSVMDVLDDGSLRFACDVEEGAVLTLMQPGDLVDSLAAFLSTDDIVAGILFHCLGRYFQADAQGSLETLATLLQCVPVAGGNTYGEQYMGLHLNHTLTGLWFQRDSQ